MCRRVSPGGPSKHKRVNTKRNNFRSHPTLRSQSQGKTNIAVLPAFRHCHSAPVWGLGARASAVWVPQGLGVSRVSGPPRAWWFNLGVRGPMGSGLQGLPKPRGFSIGVKGWARGLRAPQGLGVRPSVSRGCSLRGSRAPGTPEHDGAEIPRARIRPRGSIKSVSHDP